MRYAILSDIHGNLEALDAVLAALAGARVGRYLCAGDLVGYGADPAPCLAKIRALEPGLIAAAQRKIRAAGLPAIFADRLAVGR